jgi:hypothetical protein
MRAAAAFICVVACGGGNVNAPGGDTSNSADHTDATHAVGADDDGFRPSYDLRDVERALIAEHAKEATAERQLRDLDAQLDRDPSNEAIGDRWRAASADLAVRRRFITTLETCQAIDRGCPPRLDEPAWSWDYDADPEHAKPPPLDAPLRFDLADWRAIALELRGRACACRSMTCLDSLDVAISQLETQPTREVQGDDAALGSITAARECLFRLRGKAISKITAPLTAE